MQRCNASGPDGVHRWGKRPISHYVRRGTQSGAFQADHRSVTSARPLLGRAIAALAVAFALLALSWPVASVQATVAASDPVLQVSFSDPTGLADTELVEALQTTGFIDEWLDRSDASPIAAVLRVQGTSDYEAMRVEAISTMLSATVAERDQVSHELEMADLERKVDELSQQVAAVAVQRLGSDRELIRAATDVALARADLATSIAVADAIAEDLAADRQALLADFDRMHQLRMTATSPVDRLPLVTLDAYIQGANVAPEQCSVDWTLLAGIGRIESLHGTLDGASVSSSGTVSPRVFGPLLDGGATERGFESAAARERAAAEALAAEEAAAAAAAAAIAAQEESERRDRELFDIQPTPTPTPDPAGQPTEEELLLEQVRQSNRVETERPGAQDEAETDEDRDGVDGEEEEEGNGFAVIADTDSGRLDGNSEWDRAVGPMQFIPRTWNLFSVDGNGDGVLDPHNFHDATASAANYLCSLERRNGPDPSVFVLGYNDSTSYVEDVIETSDRLDDSYQLPMVTTNDPDS